MLVEQNKKFQSELLLLVEEKSFLKRKYFQICIFLFDFFFLEDCLIGSDFGISSDYSEVGSFYSDIFGGLLDNVWEEFFCELFFDLM